MNLIQSLKGLSLEQQENLAVEIAGVKLKNPVMNASGTFGLDYKQYEPLDFLGAYVTKSMSLKPREGNAVPRICETPSGMVNSIGLENLGIDHFIVEELPVLYSMLGMKGTKIVVSIFGSSMDEYAEAAEKLNIDGVDMIEVNISCPNVKGNGMAFGVNPDVAHDVTAAVARNTDKPVMPKLTPDAGALIGDVAEAVRTAGANAISLVNTYPALPLEVNSKGEVVYSVANKNGGLSGPAIMPAALAMVDRVYKRVSISGIPIVGMGGISTWQDALCFMGAGASAVAVGTATFPNPYAIPEVIYGLAHYVKDHGAISECVGRIGTGR